MGDRIELHEILCSIIDISEADGDNHVYFQPPEDIRMKYPAIVYSIKNIDDSNADNKPYFRTTVYKLTLIDENPDSEYVAKILELPYCSFDAGFTSDNLNHYTFTLYT